MEPPRPNKGDGAAVPPPARDFADDATPNLRLPTPAYDFADDATPNLRLPILAVESEGPALEEEPTVEVAGASSRSLQYEGEDAGSQIPDLPDLPLAPEVAFPDVAGASSRSLAEQGEDAGSSTPDLRPSRDLRSPHMVRGRRPGGAHPRRGRTLVQYTPPAPGVARPATSPSPGPDTEQEEERGEIQEQGERFGRYLLTGLLAEGGMARVHHALLLEESGFEKPLAIKCMRSGLSDDPEFVRRFADEARIASTLGHSNIVQVFDFGQVQGQYYLAMELVQGPDLGSLLDRLAEAGRTLPLSATLFVAAGVLRGLGAAHRRLDARGNPAPVVHRDMSPQNILISLSGEVKVADFGIAKAASNLVQTRAGVVMGKFFYMSPEQASGQEVDARSDIWSMGAVLYEMLAGRPLWRGSSPEELVRQVLRAPLPDLRQLGGADAPELGRILERVLCRAPYERPEDGNALARELERLLHRLSPGYSRDDLADLVRRVEGAPDPSGTPPGRSSPGLFHDAGDESPSLDELRQRWPEQASTAAQEPSEGARGVEVVRGDTDVHPIEDTVEALDEPTPGPVRVTRRGWLLPLLLGLALLLGAGAGYALSGPGLAERRLEPGATARHGAWSISLREAGPVAGASSPRFSVKLWLGHPRGVTSSDGRLFLRQGSAPLFWTMATVQGETTLRMVFAGEPGEVVFTPEGEEPLRLVFQ